MIDEKKLIDELKQSGMIADNEYGNAMVDMIENQPQVDVWIPCKERLPEDDGNVLVCWGGNNVSVGYFVSGGAGGWFFEQLAGDYKIPYEPFAWQPLPEAYQESLKQTEGEKK